MLPSITSRSLTTAENFTLWGVALLTSLAGRRRLFSIMHRRPHALKSSSAFSGGPGRRLVGTSLVFLFALVACAGSEGPTGEETASGGTVGSSGGGPASGGAASGGASTDASGGSLGSGGALTASGGAVGSGGALGSGGDQSGEGSGGELNGSGGGGSTEPVFHVFLLMGQSNMAGYSQAQAADKVENPRIKVLGFDDCAATGRVEGEWDVAAPPLHECWNSAVGPGDYFAKTLIEKYPEQDTIGLVPLAVSGSKIEPFMKSGGDKWAWIIQRAQAAQEAGGVIEGILFHQGESNCGDSAWPGKVKTLVTDLRTELGLGNAPFLAGELLRTGACANHNTLVAQLPGQIDNAHVISAQDLAMDPADTTWELHFGHDAQVTFGQRYAATMIQVLGLDP